jgi:hypothetical protein
MNLNSKTQKLELLLRSHELLTLDNAHHKMAIECKDGVIWVTSAGDCQDYLLQAGKRYVPKTNGEVVIEAINEACVDIEEN